MTWRKFRVAAFVLFFLAQCLMQLATAEELPGWGAWKSAYLESSGRVIDTGQGGISHSEGQGVGMLFAVAAGDRESFDRIWQWTSTNLGVRQDRLFAWRWEAGKGVSDTNNATDGDLFIAWALARAAQRFAKPSYAKEAQAIARDIRSKLMVETPWGLMLIPGAQGFETPQGRVINPSYWVFPALRDMGQIDVAPQWQRTVEDGLKLLRVAHFGRWGLPPDWLLLVDPVVPAPGRPPRFGYEAVRIPLYLYWAGVEDDALLTPYRRYWTFFQQSSFQPAWIRLDDDSVDTHGAPAGVLAVRDLILFGRTKSLPQASDFYYSATLKLLVRLALKEHGKQP